MRSIPFSEGELRWVFPDLADHDEVHMLLVSVDEQIRQLAAFFGSRPGWTGHGLEYSQYNIRADLQGFVEPFDVSFLIELDSAPALAQGSDDYGPPWEVDASISVRCDAVQDCGMHALERFNSSEKQHATPVAAARDLVAATAWLCGRAYAVPVASWRQRDSGCHRAR